MAGQAPAPGDSGTSRWRWPVGARIWFIFQAWLFAAAAAIAAAAVTRVPGVGAIAAVLGGGLAGYASVRCWRVSITLTPETLTVRNVFRTHHLPLTQVLEAWPGVSGIEITMRDRRLADVDGIEVSMSDRRLIRATAVQQSVLANIAGRRTRADDIAQFITGAAAARTRVRAGAPPPFVPPPFIPASNGQLAWRLAIGVVLLLGAVMMAGLPGRGAGLAIGLFGMGGILLILGAALAWHADRRLDRGPPSR
jgi:hypothetical protein